MLKVGDSVVITDVSGNERTKGFYFLGRLEGEPETSVDLSKKNTGVIVKEVTHWVSGRLLGYKVKMDAPNTGVYVFSPKELGYKAKMDAPNAGVYVFTLEE